MLVDFQSNDPFQLAYMGYPLEACDIPFPILAIEGSTPTKIVDISWTYVSVYFTCTSGIHKIGPNPAYSHQQNVKSTQVSTC